jgi:Protein of unknown function (DUF1761)
MGSEIFSHLNWLAIIAAGVAYFLLGAIWYSFIFKHAWIKHSGVNVNDPNMKKGMAQTMIASLVLMIICSLGLALLLGKIVSTSWMSGAKLGLLAGVCFSATAICISYLYEKRPWMLHFINAGYNVAGCVIAGIILSVWP